MRALERGLRYGNRRPLIELGPPVVDRMALSSRPDLVSLISYVMTGGAQRAWQTINLRLREPNGALFWIGGRAGAGKTHFLNYALTVHRKVGSDLSGKPRRLTVGIEVAGQGRGADPGSQLLDAICRELSIDTRDAMLWKRMNELDGLGLAFDHARRLGFGSMMAVVDLGVVESESVRASLDLMARWCESRHPKLIVIAAGRGASPATAAAFDVTPADDDERLTVAIGRARRVSGESDPEFEEFYRTIDLGRFEPRAVFPFHPLSVETVRVLVGSGGTIAEMARLFRDVLAPEGEARSAAFREFVAPADLMRSPAVSARVDARLGESGRAALKMARAALDKTTEGALAREVVDTLVLAHLGGGRSALAVAELRSRLPSHGGAVESNGGAARIGALLSALAGRAGSVIRFESGAVRFDPRGAGAPEVAAFNAALPLIRKFDATITAAEELPELKAKLKRLADAMAEAFENANRTGEILAPTLREPQGRLPPERHDALSDYIALASRGPAVLLEAATDPATRARALKTIAAYETLAGAAAALPRVSAMREYLDATGLRWTPDGDQGRGGKVSALESECQLLSSQFAPDVLLGEPRKLDALHAAFQKFRWSYVQEYRAAHEQWRKEMLEVADAAGDARRHVDALGRLNSIAGLGPPAGQGLEPALSEIERRIVVCEFDGPLASEGSARCPRCGFVLGARSPKSELDELADRIRTALGVKLAELSRSTIARLIREHDFSHRLEGMLKIIQAAGTEALVRVLDDDLAGYLARLIDENLDLAGQNADELRPPEPARGVLRRNGHRRRQGGSKMRS